MKLIKQKFLTDEEKYYSYPVKVLDQSDISLLDKSKTTGLIHFNSEQMDHPRYWNCEKFKLPFNVYTLVEYENVCFNSIRKHLPYFDEGSRIEIVTDESDIHDYEYIEKVFPALNYGGCMWQHFVQDILPILIFSKDFLNQNADITLLFYEDLKEKHFTKYFLDKLQIKNPIQYTPYYYPYTEEKYIYKCKKLYNFECDNQIPTYWWNNFFYEDINRELVKEESQKNNLIYCRRINNRIFKNEQEVREVLQNYANENNLNYIEFEEQYYTMHQKETIFKDAHTVIAPHGGANYHIIFCSPGTKFIEYTFVDCMYSLYNIASSLKLDYYMVPNEGTNSTLAIYVDINKLNTLLNCNNKMKFYVNGMSDEYCDELNSKIKSDCNVCIVGWRPDSLLWTYDFFTEQKSNITLIEIFESNARAFPAEKYNTNVICDSVENFDQYFNKEDKNKNILYWGDGPEHLTMDESKKLLEKAKDYFYLIIIQTPDGVHEQGSMYGNDHESHLSTWYETDFKELRFKPHKVEPTNPALIGYYCE